MENPTPSGPIHKNTHPSKKKERFSKSRKLPCLKSMEISFGPAGKRNNKASWVGIPPLHKTWGKNSFNQFVSFTLPLSKVQINRQIAFHLDPISLPLALFVVCFVWLFHVRFVFCRLGADEEESEQRSEETQIGEGKGKADQQRGKETGSVWWCGKSNHLDLMKWRLCDYVCVVILFLCQIVSQRLSVTFSAAYVSRCSKPMIHPVFNFKKYGKVFYYPI